MDNLVVNDNFTLQVCTMPTPSSPILPQLVPYLSILVKLLLASGEVAKG